MLILANLSEPTRLMCGKMNRIQPMLPLRQWEELDYYLKKHYATTQIYLSIMLSAFMAIISFSPYRNCMRPARLYTPFYKTGLSEVRALI